MSSNDFSITHYVPTQLADVHTSLLCTIHSLVRRHTDPFLECYITGILPVVAAQNQNRSQSPDSTIMALAIIMIEMFVDPAYPFCHCSFGVLKWLLTPFESRNCIFSSDLYSPALSCIKATNLCLVRKLAMSAYHLFTTSNASSLVFSPYIQLQRQQVNLLT